MKPFAATKGRYHTIYGVVSPDEAVDFETTRDLLIRQGFDVNKSPCRCCGAPVFIVFDGDGDVFLSEEREDGTAVFMQERMAQ